MNVEVKPSATAYKLKIDRDVDVPMRDGAKLKADVFRPDDGGKFPALLNLGPYQKDKLWVPDNLEEKQKYMNWETVKPGMVGAAGIRLGARRWPWLGQIAGPVRAMVHAEAVDFYDAIEWAAAQPWCNGKVGLTGISYYAINQWFVANLNPPSLKAIMPWEGFADIYRDALYHGGIFSVFMSNWITAHTDASHAGPRFAAICRMSGTRTRWLWLRNNLDSGALRGAQAQWDQITVPM